MFALNLFGRFEAQDVVREVKYLLEGSDTISNVRILKKKKSSKLP